MSGGKKARPFAFILDDVLAALPIHGMPPAERAILRAIATHAGPDGGGAFPSFERLSRLTGLGVSTVAKAIRVLCSNERRWLSKQARRDEKTGASTSNTYCVHLDGVPWGDEQAAKRKRNPPAPPSNRRTPPVQTTEPGGGGVQSADTPHPIGGVTGVQSADTPSAPDADDPPINPFREPTKEPPIARPRARAGGESMPLFPSSEPSASTPKGPAREKRPKAPKPPRERTAAERYADAFVEAFTLRGRTVSRPTTAETAMLGKLCRDHARDRAGAALVGDALPVWIRAQVVAMLDGVEDFTRHRGGASVHGLRHWLDTAGPARVRELEPKSAARPALADDDAPFCEPPAMRDEDVLRAALTLPPGEGRDAVVAKYQARVGVGV